ncbi:MAG: sterol desaturase family protein [Planktomarina sp.]
MESAWPITIFGLLFVAMFALESWMDRDGAARPQGKRRFTNIILFFLGSGVMAVLPISVFVAAIWGRAQGWGAMSLLGVPSGLNFVIGFVAVSLGGYVFHRLTHHIPFLWRFHQVHHSDDFLDVTTTLRHHPVELAFGAAFMSILVVILGVTAAAYAAHVIFAACVGIIQHSRITWSPHVERWVRLGIMTPKLHHIHHSTYVRETDSNYSIDLAIWDHVFGTFQGAPLRPPHQFAYGLNQCPQPLCDDLDHQLVVPFMKQKKDAPKGTP